MLDDPRIGQTQAKLLLSSAPDTIDDAGGCDLRYGKGSTRPVGWGEQDRGQYDAVVQCYPCGGAMMVRTELFGRLGGFDEVFNPYGPEDLDFSLRVGKAGYESWYIPTAVAHHDRTHTFRGDSYSMNYGRHRSRHWLELMRRHASPLDWLGFLIVGVPLIGMRVLRREGRKGNFGAMVGVVRGVFDRKRWRVLFPSRRDGRVIDLSTSWWPRSPERSRSTLRSHQLRIRTAWGRGSLRRTRPIPLRCVIGSREPVPTLDPPTGGGDDPPTDALARAG